LLACHFEALSVSSGVFSADPLHIEAPGLLFHAGTNPWEWTSAEMGHFDVVQANFIRPMIGALKDAGAPVRKYMMTAGLDKFKFEDPDSFVPLKCFLDFFEIVARKETGTIIPVEVLMNYKILEMGVWGRHLASRHDLLSVCEDASSPKARLFSNESLDFQIAAGNASITNHWTGDRSLPQRWCETISLRLMIDAIDLVDEKDSAPNAIWIKGNPPAELVDIVSESTPVMQLDRPGIGISFSAKLLSAQMRTSGAGGNDNLILDTKIPTTLTERVEAILDMTSDLFIPSVQSVAYQADMSARNLQRKLQLEGSSFTDILRRWRLKHAIELLGADDLPIKEISYRLRYSHTAHFVRGFKSLTGMTPSQFRHNHR
jgi:AraC-like DNA-binding protein